MHLRSKSWRWHWELCCLFLLISDPADAAESLVRLVVHDATTDRPVPCRIHLKDASGKPVVAKSLPSWRDHFVCPGETELSLAPGEYSFELDRGPEYFVTVGEFAVTDAPTLVLTNQLRRMIDLRTEGWWSGETHVHRPLGDIDLLMRAEDLHVAPVITWWNASNPWRTNPLPAAPVRQFDGDRFRDDLGGEDERGGGALLFFQMRRPLPITGAKREFPSPMRFLAQAREQPDAWVDVEKPFWLDVPVWLASGRVDSIGIAHNHMHRGGVLDNEAWGKARDRSRYPGPRGNGFWTQDIYYHLLNCGLRLPPSAGSASGVLPNPVGYNRAYVQLTGELTHQRWWSGLREGRVFVSNGPLLRLRANGEWPGHVFRSEPGGELRLRLEGRIDSRDPLSRIEIIRNGSVERTVSADEFKRTGSLGALSFNESGWFLVRTIADVPNTFRFASTGPFYVEAGRAPRRISRASAQFFLDWTRERASQLATKLPEDGERTEVLRHHDEAEQFWRRKVAEANAD